MTTPTRRLMCLLKDADGLDRVRLGDLDLAYLRRPEAREVVHFPEHLYRDTEKGLRLNSCRFAEAWSLVGRSGKPR
jgi:hypothetical protein